MMSNEQMVDISNKLSEVDKELGMQFAYAPDKYKFLKDNEEVLRNNRNFTDVYNTYKDLVGDRMKRLDKLMKDRELYTKDITPAEMQSFLAKNPDIGESDVNEYITKSREYKKYYEDERKKQAGKTRREMEVKNWSKEGPWYRNVMASDYEKQRYIDDPNQAIFGDEAPLFGDAPETRWGAYGDFGAGAVAAAADVVPTPLHTETWLGPVIRGGRDVAHKLTDSPYQKDNITGSFAYDLGLNAFTDFMPTAILKKGSKLTKNVGKVSDVISNAQYYNVANKAMKDVESGIKSIGGGDWNKIYEISQNPILWEKEISRLSKDNPMRADLLALKDSPQSAKLEALTNWASTAGLTHPYLYKELPSGEMVVKPYFMEQMSQPQRNYMETILKGNLDNASTTTKALSTAADLWKGYGESGVKAGLTANDKRSVVKPTREQTKIEKLLTNQQKNDYKRNEARFWKAGFAPRKIEGDPLWEAYKEWYKEEYGTDVEDK